MRILILEDEVLAKNRLTEYINQSLDVSKIDWGRSVEEGLEFIKSQSDYDLIFSDIQLIDGLSFEIFNKVTPKVPIIFCTAFDQYLLKAFQTNGIAYVLKPFDKETFQQAIDKYKMLVSSKNEASLPSSVLQSLISISKDQKRTYKSRFSIKKNGGIKLLNVNEVVCFEANGSFCIAYDQNNKKHLISYSISNVEDSIDPNMFYRTNRSDIVNINFIDKIEGHFKNRLLIKFRGTSKESLTSSTRTADFRTWLER